MPPESIRAYGVRPPPAPSTLPARTIIVGWHHHRGWSSEEIVIHGFLCGVLKESGHGVVIALSNGIEFVIGQVAHPTVSPNQTAPVVSTQSSVYMASTSASITPPSLVVMLQRWKPVRSLDRKLGGEQITGDLFHGKPVEGEISVEGGGSPSPGRARSRDSCRSGVP